MKMHCSRPVREEKGKVLIMVLILLVVGGLVLTPLLGLMSTGLMAGQVYEGKMLQLYAADAGVEEAIHWLLEGKPDEHPWVSAEESDPWDWERGADLGINRNNVGVTIERLPADDTYKIISTATDDHRQTTVTAVVRVAARFKGCILSEPLALRTRTEMTVEGEIYVMGHVTLEQYSEISATGMYIEGDLVLEENSSITVVDEDGSRGVICVTGDITLENHTRINADIHFLGGDCTLTIEFTAPDARVRGNIWAEGELTIDVMAGSQAATEIDCPEGIYARCGPVSVHLDKKNSELRGAIYARDTTITGNGNYAGYEYRPCEEDDCAGDNCQEDNCGEVTCWVRVNGESEPIYDPPFYIPDCPEIDSGQVHVHIYEVT